jgi:hypothetical protein
VVATRERADRLWSSIAGELLRLPERGDRAQSERRELFMQLPIDMATEVYDRGDEAIAFDWAYAAEQLPWATR